MLLDIPRNELQRPELGEALPDPFLDVLSTRSHVIPRSPGMAYETHTERAV